MLRKVARWLQQAPRSVAAAMPPRPIHIGEPTYLLTSPQIQASAEDVHQYLLDAQKLPEIHPMIISVKEVGQRSQTLNGFVTQEFTITDDMKLCCGLITTHPAYSARVWYSEFATDPQVSWRAVAPAGVLIEHEFTVSAAPLTDGKQATCIVEQKTWVAAPWLVRGYTIKSAKKAHDSSLKALAAHFNFAQQ